MTHIFFHVFISSGDRYLLSLRFQLNGGFQWFIQVLLFISFGRRYALTYITKGSKMILLSNTLTVLAVFSAIGLLLYLGVTLIYVALHRDTEHRLLCFVSGVAITSIPIISVLMALIDKGVI